MLSLPQVKQEPGPMTFVKSEIKETIEVCSSVEQLSEKPLAETREQPRSEPLQEEPCVTNVQPNQQEKEQRVTNGKRKKTKIDWERDNPENKSSMDVLLDWLCSPRNYHDYHTSRASREKYHRAILNKMLQSGITWRNAKNIRNKISFLEKRFVEANLWLRGKGDRIMALSFMEQQGQADLVRRTVRSIMKHYERVYPVMSQFYTIYEGSEHQGFDFHSFFMGFSRMRPQPEKENQQQQRAELQQEKQIDKPSLKLPSIAALLNKSELPKTQATLISGQGKEIIAKMRQVVEASRPLVDSSQNESLNCATNETSTTVEPVNSVGATTLPKPQKPTAVTRPPVLHSKPRFTPVIPASSRARIQPILAQVVQTEQATQTTAIQRDHSSQTDQSTVIKPRNESFKPAKRKEPHPERDPMESIDHLEKKIKLETLENQRESNRETRRIEHLKFQLERASLLRELLTKRDNLVRSGTSQELVDRLFPLDTL